MKTRDDRDVPDRGVTGCLDTDATSLRAFIAGFFTLVLGVVCVPDLGLAAFRIGNQRVVPVLEYCVLGMRTFSIWSRSLRSGRPMAGMRRSDELLCPCAGRTSRVWRNAGGGDVKRRIGSAVLEFRLAL